MSRRAKVIGLCAATVLASSACSLGAAGPTTAGTTAGGPAPAQSPAGTTAATLPPPPPHTANAAWDANPVTLTFGGDVMLADMIGSRVLKEGPGTVFSNLRGTLSQADIAVVNVESALGPETARTQPEPKNYTFMGPPVAAKALVDGGIDLVTLANNHTYDYGVPGITSTLQSVDAVGIPHVGLGLDATSARTPVILERKGMRIAFLGYTRVVVEPGYDNHRWAAGPGKPGVAWAEPAEIRADVAAARAKADHVIVLLHTGHELTTNLDEGQVAAADAALAAGATAVIGHHPHVLQGYDWKRDAGTLVAWSLGNSVFYPFAHANSNRSALLSIELASQGVTSMRWTPTRIDRQGRTWLVDPTSDRGRLTLEQAESSPKRLEDNVTAEPSPSSPILTGPPVAPTPSTRRVATTGSPPRR